jgi:23S rRNA (adenine2503-C2)-methyltransferase
MIYLQSLTRTELQALIKPLSRKSRRGLSEEEVEAKVEAQARYRSRQIFQWVYQRFVTDWDEMTDLSKELRAWLKENVAIYRLEEALQRQALDGTMKFLWSLGDSKTIESVIIPAALQEKTRAAESDLEAGVVDSEDDDRAPVPTEKIVTGWKPPTASEFAGREAPEAVKAERWGRLTACISSQVGCAMACKFCLTGVQGLDRHLQVHEIVTQVHELRRIAPITNIVFMGMGEPLHNLENVIRACEILLDQDGLNFSRRKVTVSTSGLVPAIEELGRRVPVSLAVSLNGTTDEQRSMIMPVNKKWNIETLLEACRKFPVGSHRRITFEYVLLEGINDSLEDAARLLQLLRGIPSKINLIPFNEHPASEYKRPKDEVVRAFQKYLVDRKLTATVRISRGRDILAACGQLRSIFGTARGTEKHKDWKPLPVVTA